MRLTAGINQTGGKAGSALLAIAVPMLAVLLYPRNAYALPNPFFLAVLSDIMIQLLVVAALSLPLALVSIRRRYYRLLPRSSYRYAAALLLLVVVSSVYFEFASGESGNEKMEADPLDVRLENCRPLSSELARKLKLPEGAFLLDPRHPLAFQSYHLEGSCNFSHDEVLHLPSVRNKLRGEGKSLVLTVEDAEIFPSELFQGSPLLALSSDDPELPDMSGVSWDKIKDGMNRYYKGLDKTASYNGRGIGQAPDSVVDYRGNPVSISFGPFWMMGKYLSVIGDDPDWRQLRPAAIRHVLESGGWVVDLRHSGAERVSGHVIRIRHYMADLDRLDGLAAGEMGGALFVCNSSRSCLAGEILARELKERGGRLLGYVQFYPGSAGDEDPGFGYPGCIDPQKSLLLAWLMLFATLMLSPLISAASARALMLADSRMKRTSFFYKARILSGMTPLLLLTFILPVSGEFTQADLSHGWLNTLFFDIKRSGLPFMGGAYALIFIGLVMLIEKRLARASLSLRGFLLLLFCIPWFMQGPTVVPLTFSLYEIVLIIVMIYSQAIAELLLHLRRRSIIRRGLKKSALFCLNDASEADYCGAKIAWLAQAEKDGLSVPPGVVLLARARAADIEQALQSTAAMLGAGPYVVRSSAPDEDLAGDITPGKYHSEHDVAPNRLAVAVAAVLDDYVAQGLSAEAPAAVLIQRQVKGRSAGVAMRESVRRGSGILVEYAEAFNFAITSGRGGNRTARIGGIYRNWLERSGERNLPAASCFNDVFERLALRFGKNLEIEWTYAGGRLVLLQARHAPREIEMSPHPAAELLEQMKRRLDALAMRPKSIVLDSRDLGDLPEKVSTATFELLRDIWHNSEVVREAFGPLLARLHPGIMEPALLRLYGKIYFNRVPARPRLALLKSPALRALGLLLPFLTGRRIAELDEKIRMLESSATIPIQDRATPKAQEAARHLLEARRKIIDGSGRISAATAMLVSGALKRKELFRLEERDPFLLALASGKSGAELAAVFPMRAVHDLLLEEPRLSEIFDVRVRRLGMNEIETSGDKLGKLAALRGRARQVLAADAASLRMAYLALARALQVDNIFDLPLEFIEATAGGKVWPAVASEFSEAPQHSESLPPSLDLRQLEIMAAENRIDGGGMAGKAVIIGKPEVESATALIARPGKALVAPTDGDGAANVALLMNSPDIQSIAVMPAEWLLVCRGGSALCHAALLARNRSINAVFNAAMPGEPISDGDLISIDAEACINIIRKN